MPVSYTHLDVYKRQVLEQRPECKVIFITAYSLFQYAHEAVHLGACDYLLKPVDPDETEAAIRRAIRQLSLIHIYHREGLRRCAR